MLCVCGGGGEQAESAPYRVALAYAALSAAAAGVVAALVCRERDCRAANEALESAGLSTGIGATIAGGYALVLSATPSPALAVLRLPLAGAVDAHALLGRAALVGLAAHGALYVAAWWVRGGPGDMWDELIAWQGSGVANLPGALSLAAAAVLLATAHNAIRRAFYTIFYAGHILGTLGFYLLGVMHATAVLYYCAPASVLWAAEAARRSLRARVQGARLTRLGATLARVELPPSASCAAVGPSYLHAATDCGGVHVNLARASKLFGRELSAYIPRRSHPFSVIGPRGCTLVTYVRAVGKWTIKLVEDGEEAGVGDPEAANDGNVGHGGDEKLAFKAEPSIALTPSLTVDGPHETHVAAPADADDPRVDVLLVGGGTGLVPLIQLVHARVRASVPACGGHVHLVLLARDPEDVEMLESLPAGESVDAVLVHHKSGKTEEVRRRAEAALARRRATEPAAACSRAFAGGGGVLLLSAATHAAAALGVYLGARLAFEVPQEPQWAFRLAAAALLNGGALICAVVAAHAGALLASLLAYRDRATARRYDDLDSPEATSMADELDLTDTSAAGTCQLHVTSGRADLAALVGRFATERAEADAQATPVVVSAGSDRLILAVADACRQKGLRHAEASYRINTA